MPVEPAVSPPEVPRGHPRGLSTLFFTEMWERFSFYGMRSLLTLYLIAPAEEGGLGMTKKEAGSVYGWYLGLVYAASLPGGWIADRYLGQFRAVLLGGIIIAFGHFSMAIDSIPFFYVGLGLIIAGTGLLKPNVSSQVGALYGEGDLRRDAGFSIFYMGINLGAFIAPLVCGTLGQEVRWHWGFAAAGVGMVLGLIQYWLGRAPLLAANRRLEETKRALRASNEAAGVFFSPGEWRRLAVIAVLFLFSAIFWAAFEQAGSSLTVFADEFTRRSVFGRTFPSSWFQSVNSLFIIALAPVFAWLWRALGSRQPGGSVKFALGLLFAGQGFLLLVPAARLAQPAAGEVDPVSPWWLVGVYFCHTVGELCLSPVGLSLMTSLAPPRIMGSVMGIWFLSTAVGGKVGGWVAGLVMDMPLSQLFGSVFATAAGAGVLLALLARPIERLAGTRR